MRVFADTLETFQRKIATNELFDELGEGYIRVVGRSASPSEVRSWNASLPRLESVLRLAKLPADTWIALEERIPYYAKRIDALLFGLDRQGHQHMVLVELKAWSEATALPDGNVQTVLGRGLQDESHPSEQVQGYQQHLHDFGRAFHGTHPITLSACAYCHNYTSVAPDSGLFHPQYDFLRAQSPTFGQRDATELADFLHHRLAGGGGAAVVQAFDRAGIGPSQALIDHADAIIKGQRVFQLLDTQLAANKTITYAIKHAMATKGKQVILVRGGAGTGKTVIALNAFGEAFRRELDVRLVAGSSAYTHSMRALLGRRLSGLIRFTDFAWNMPHDEIDIVIVDEAHRIRARSEPRIPRDQRPTISQIDELIRAAKVVVLFADEQQIISPDEVGELEVFATAAAQAKATFSSYELTSQFRCNGSDVYLEWLNDVFGLEANTQGLQLTTPTGFDFKIVDTPHELVAEVQRYNAAASNTARILAGWCWPWSDPNPDGSLVDDIVIDDFRFPWELKNGRKGEPGIPEAKLWAMTPAGVAQAGTVYSVQGFEARHVGVILGPDLVVRNGVWIGHPERNYSNQLRRRSPEQAVMYLKRIYRTLLSRGMQSCSVYCVDVETKHYLESRIIRHANEPL